MRAALILVVLAGCGESDPCASFAGQTCIALRVNGTVAVDQLGITGTGVFSEKRTPGVRRATPFALPVAVAVLPGDVDSVTLQVRGYQLDVAVGEGTTNVILDRGRLTRAEVTLLGTGVDLAGVDVAGVDLAPPPQNDLTSAGADMQVATPPFFAANSGLFGGTITYLVSDFAMRGVWVATRGAGIFRSDDAGQSWRAVNEGLGALDVDAFAASPVGAGYFAAVHDNSRSSLYRSQDGVRWTKTSDLPGHATVIEFTGAFTMLVGLVDAGVLRSMDNGVTLVPARAGIETATVTRLLSDPISPGTVFAGINGGGLFKTTDAGDIWTAMSTGLSGTVRTLAYDPASLDLVAGTSTGMFVLKVGMTSWTAFSPALPQNPLRFAFAQQGTRDFYASGSFELYRLSGSDTAWSDVTDPAFESEQFVLIAMDRSDSKLVYATTAHRGPIVTTNSGASWTRARAGITNLQMLSVAIDPAQPNVVYAGSIEGLYRSVDRGATWTALTNGIPDGRSIDMIAVGPTYVLSATSAAVFRSADGGASWAMVDTVGSIALAIDSRGVAYSAPRVGGLRKAANGMGWGNANNGLSGTVQTIAPHPTDPTIVYAGTGGNGMFKTSDDAVSWQPVTSTVLPTLINAIAIDPGTPSTLYAASGDSMFKSTNDGAVWVSSAVGLDGDTFMRVRVAKSRPEVVYTVNTKGVFRSDDRGTTWSALGAQLGLDNTMDLAIDPTNENVGYFAVARGPGVVKTVTGGK